MLAARTSLPLGPLLFGLVHASAAAELGPDPATYPQAAADLRMDTRVGGNYQAARADTRVGTRLFRERPGPGLEMLLDTELAFDDNVFRSAADQRSDLLLQLSPSLSYHMQMGKHSAELSYRGAYGRYRHLDSQDYADHELRSAVLLDLTKRLNVELQAEIRAEHEDRGLVSSQRTNALDPNRYTDSVARAKVTYGRRIATMELSLTLEHGELRYKNNGQQTRDRNADTLRATAYYNLGPKLALLAEVEKRRLRYQQSAVAQVLDSNETRYLAGLSWDATARTSGEIKAGWQYKDPLNQGGASFSGYSLQGEVLWEPRPYSKVRLNAARRTDETLVAGTSYAVLNEMGMRWRHEFNRRWVLDTSYDHLRADYDDDAGISDRYQQLNTGLSYRVLDWLELGASLQHSRRDSDLAGAEFTDNMLVLSASGTLGRSRTQAADGFAVPGIEWFPDGYSPRIENELRTDLYQGQ